MLTVRLALGRDNLSRGSNLHSGPFGKQPAGEVGGDGRARKLGRGERHSVLQPNSSVGVRQHPRGDHKTLWENDFRPSGNPRAPTCVDLVRWEVAWARRTRLNTGGCPIPGLEEAKKFAASARRSRDGSQFHAETLPSRGGV